MSAPLLVLSNNSSREEGRKVQSGNIHAVKNVADLIRTCLGPRAMLKMLMDPMGGIVMTNDGHAILREIVVKHPAAKSLIEISRTQDEEVGDGTTSVIVLAAEMLSVAEPLLLDQMHPTVIIRAYRQLLEDALELMKTKIATKIDAGDKKELIKMAKSCIGTKFLNQWSDMACDIALKAVDIVTVKDKNGKVEEIDVKKYAKVEKIIGGTIEDCRVIDGCMINKDILHSKMRRRIEKPKVILLDCSLEYKKAESQLNVELLKEKDFTRILELEEEYIKEQVANILKFKPDVVCTEKGVSDLAIHYLADANVTVLRRLRKTDNNRIARATGATIVNRTDEIRVEDVGEQCQLFNIDKFGDEYFSFFEECINPKACTILLRGSSKDIMNEIERNLEDAIAIVRNIMLDGYVVPGGGATEIHLSKLLLEKCRSIKDVTQWPYKAGAQALEIIPRTLIQNCGSKVIKVLTSLKVKHDTNDDKTSTWGIDGDSGKIVDMNDFGVWEPMSVKSQIIKTSIETAILLLRIDDIVSGSKKASTLSERPQEPIPEVNAT
ncbi:hypothetical protein SNEBB_004487 [Seison nebaliae]|nr:hypothetical protein SNEBB_004487 [Seison nebaliae]